MNDDEHAPPAAAARARRRERAGLLLRVAAPRGRPRPRTSPRFDAHGRVLAADVRSQLDVPPADNSAMDGYAVRAADCAGGRRGAAGSASASRPASSAQPLAAGHGGAHLHRRADSRPGADAVVMQEQCERRRRRRAHRCGSADAGPVDPPRAARTSQRGARGPAAGARLRRRRSAWPRRSALATLQVARRPRVALFSTGDELAMPGEPLQAGRDLQLEPLHAARPARSARLRRHRLRHRARPPRRHARRAARAAAEGNDLIVTCGGVSVGEEDHIKPAVEAEGRLDLWQIAIKPGKPLAFGEVRRADGASAWFIGLPGNPVSSFVTFLLLVRPFLLRLQGASDVRAAADRAARRLRLAASPTAAASSCACAATPPAGSTCSPNQGSGVLTSTVWADGLVDNPPGQAIAPGDTVRYLSLPELLAMKIARPLFRRRCARRSAPARTVESGRAPTVGDVARTRCVARGGAHAEALAPRARRCAWRSNQVLCAEATPLGDGGEVGFFPPVTGG